MVRRERAIHNKHNSGEILMLSRRRLGCALALWASLWTSGFATTVKPMNIVDLIDRSATIVAGRVEKVSDGFTAGGLPYTEVTVRVLDRFRGAAGDTYTFRQFGLSAPRTLPNGKVYLGRPEGWPTWKAGEVSIVFLYPKARVTGFQTTVGLGYGKLGMGNGVAVNAFDNVGLFSTANVDRSKLSADERKMFDAKNGPVNADTLRSFLRRTVGAASAGSSTDAH
jgi:hypothetical protein